MQFHDVTISERLHKCRCDFLLNFDNLLVDSYENRIGSQRLIRAIKAINRKMSDDLMKRVLEYFVELFLLLTYMSSPPKK